MTVLMKCCVSPHILSIVTKNNDKLHQEAQRKQKMAFRILFGTKTALVVAL
jgi:hypothetical protein